MAEQRYGYEFLEDSHVGHAKIPAQAWNVTAEIPLRGTDLTVRARIQVDESGFLEVTVADGLLAVDIGRGSGNRLAIEAYRWPRKL